MSKKKPSPPCSLFLPLVFLSLFFLFFFQPPPPPPPPPLPTQNLTPPSGSWALFYIIEAIAVVTVLKRFPDDRAAAVSFLFSALFSKRNARARTRPLSLDCSLFRSCFRVIVLAPSRCQPAIRHLRRLLQARPEAFLQGDWRLEQQRRSETRDDDATVSSSSLPGWQC